jgi:hypothetical protein
MSFTRKHYEECARIIKHAREDVEHDPRLIVECMQADFSRMFASDNPRFDAERFAKACEPGSAK